MKHVNPALRRRQGFVEPPRAIIDEIADHDWSLVGHTADTVIVTTTPETVPSETQPEMSAPMAAVPDLLTAYLIRSTTPDLELKGRWAETLFLPISNSNGLVSVYTRTTNGAKGRGNAWPTAPIPDSINEALAQALDGHRVVGTALAALSAAEKAEVQADGWSRALATRITHLGLTASADALENLVTQMAGKAWTQILSHEAQPAVEEVEQEAEVPTSPSSPFEPVSEDALQALKAVSVSVPSGPAVEGYVGRQIVAASGHEMTDFEVFDLAAEEHLNVLLVGDTGAGKTTGVRAWARHHGAPCYVVPGNGPLDPPSLFGRFIPDPLTGTFVWVDGPVTTLLRHGGVLVLDEINMVSAKVLSVLYPLLDGRREVPLLDHSGEVVHAHKDLVVFATMNEGHGYSGTGVLSHAIKNRFLILRWGYDQAVEETLIGSDNLRLVGKRIREQQEAGEVETPTTTNSLMTFERLAKRTKSLDLAVEVFLNRYTEGAERNAVQVVFDAFRANIEDDLGLSAPKKVNPNLRKEEKVPDTDTYTIIVP